MTSPSLNGSGRSGGSGGGGGPGGGAGSAAARLGGWGGGRGLGGGASTARQLRERRRVVPRSVHDRRSSEPLAGLLRGLSALGLLAADRDLLRLPLRLLADGDREHALLEVRGDRAAVDPGGHGERAGERAVR